MTTPPAINKKSRARVIYHGIMRHWQLYLLMLLPIVWVITFKYVPIWGSQIAFKDYKFAHGIAGSAWATPIYKHFLKFFTSNQFQRLMTNTIGLSLYNILVGIFPPIILAIALNYCRSKVYSKTVQMVTYMPYFISTVLVVSILTQMLSLSGIVNKAIEATGGKAIQFLSKPGWFKTLYVFSEVWQKTGYNAVVYIAALAAISPELHEAAIVDGANIWQRILHVDIPGILPTAITLTIMACGRILTMGYEKVLLMQNLQNMRASDIISTYVYRIGLAEGMQFSYSTAIGLFQSVVSLLMLTLVNGLSRKLSDNSLW
ncbi:MAG: sugar ABC transporter permease [Clostridia bacterium]|nr:sugar ABC transporter permease [Clostridia bacterium]